MKAGGKYADNVDCEPYAAQVCGGTKVHDEAEFGLRIFRIRSVPSLPGFSAFRCPN